MAIADIGFRFYNFFPKNQAENRSNRLLSTSFEFLLYQALRNRKPAKAGTQN